LPPISIDDLVYTYTANTNKLQNVIDNTNNTCGFNNGNKSSVDYTYDLNGNLKTDANKGITEIIYNHLNLPTKITFGMNYVRYIYDAIGQKMEKTVSNMNNSSSQTLAVTDYLGGFQYTKVSTKTRFGTTVDPKKSSQFFPTEGGYYNFLKNSYVFNYTDHLGNVRLSYEKDATTGSLKILEESNYYPFGLKHSPSAVLNAQPSYKYKYNGKELQDELGLNMYDYGARNYDPALGRWMNMDNHAGSYTSYSPYNYVTNNPTNVIDPDGNDIYILIWATDRKNGKYGHAGIAVDNYKQQNKKDSQGNNVLDENGNAVTEMVKDGTYTYYDLWPGVDNDGDGTGDDFGSATPNLRDSFVGMPSYYRNRKLNNFNGDSSGAEDYPADGIIKLNAGYDETMETVEDLDSYMASNKNYKSALNNCSNFALEATLEALDKMGAFTSRGAMESYLGGYNNIVTPNQLYKYLQKIVSSNPTEGRVVKSPGTKVDEKFTSNKEIKGN